MAVDVVVTETSLTYSASSNLMTQESPRKRVATNDGRANRTRRVNVDFGMRNSPSLPPSTSGGYKIDIGRVDGTFNAIARSIDRLADSHMNRPTDEIYDKIIKTMQDKALAERQGCPPNLLEVYQRKIEHLEREQELATRHMELYYSSVNQVTQDDIENSTEDAINSTRS